VTDDVVDEPLRTVVDPRRLLEAAARRGDRLGLAAGAPAELLRALDEDHAAAAVGGENRSEKAAGARADDHQIGIFLSWPPDHGGGH
jgi:hypothetical protein